MLPRIDEVAVDLRRAGRLAVGLAVLAAVAVGTGLFAQQPPPARKIRFRLVAADAPTKLVSDLQSFAPLGGGGPFKEPPKPAPGGQAEACDATLWVRGATIDGKFGFEKFLNGNYLGREGQLTVDFKDLGAGEHVINPGGHRFAIDAQGTITSQDPDIAIEGDTVSLKLYRVDILPVDAQRPGPPETRLLPQALSVFLTAEGMAVTPESRPAVATIDKPAGCPSMVSHPGTFSALRIYLPANSVGPGYLLYPCYQAFAVKPGGSVEFTATRLQGITAEGGTVVIPHHRVATKLQGKGGLMGKIGSQVVTDAVKSAAVSPVLGGNFFTAGFGRPSKTFGMMLDDEVVKSSALTCVMDNLTPDVEAVRLLVQEQRGSQALESGGTVTMTLRYMENWLEFRTADLADCRTLHAALRAHAAAKDAGGPVGVLTSHVTDDDDRKAITAWHSADAPSAPDAALQAALVAMLNGGLHDPRLTRKETFAGTTLPPAAQALLDKGLDNGPGADAPEAVPTFNRALLAAWFPGSFRPFTRRPTISRPATRIAYSPHNPRHLPERRWTAFEPLSWANGVLTYKVPELPLGLYAFRAMVEDAAEPGVPTGLQTEFHAYVIGPGQKGTASFVSNKGRDAFVAGEDIRLSATIRSAEPRPAGPRTVVLLHPGGRKESFPVQDAGGTWWAQPLVLPAAVTRNLKPGAYELSFADLPGGIGQLPFRFDLAGSQRASPYLIVKSTKYTGPMLGLIGGYPAADVDRAVTTLAGMGFNRIDHMSYGGSYRGRLNAPSSAVAGVYDPREMLAAADPRLMAPEAVYVASARDQILNACVRNQVEFSDVLVTYNDFHLPRYIEPYIDAARRWITRECLSMRHSPAFAGMDLYDEVYEKGLVRVPDLHETLWPKLRGEVAEKTLGRSPTKIRTDAARAVARPAGQRDVEAIQRFLDLRRHEMQGWGDFNTRVAAAARDVLPKGRFGAKQSSFLYVTTGYGSVVSATDFDCGYSPDVFENLDIATHQHYCDNLSGWVHSSIMVPLLRFGGRPRQVLANIPLFMEINGKYDGQYSRQMAFAMLAQGADGVSQFALPHDFNDGPNPGTLAGMETTRRLNEEILAPFGELVSRTEPGYDRVAIVLTLNQLSLSEFKEIRTANQAEELWLACWRLGYPATFLREDAFEKSLDTYRVIFVPGIRFEGELTPRMLERLQAAINAGCKVVVERGSTLDLKGVTRLDDFSLQNYFYGSGYNPANFDDALYRVFSKSQPAVEYLATRLPAWVEPAAKGPFKVGPNWRTSGGINYLVMANFDDPEYSQMSAQHMAKPVRMPLEVPAHRGRAAYDLLAQKPVPLSAAANGTETALEVDMTRLQGAIVAFLPEPVGRLRVDVEQTPDQRRCRVSATLVGDSGKPIPGLFPATLRLMNPQGEVEQAWQRVLGDAAAFELDLPGDVRAGLCRLEVRENIAGQTCTAQVATPVLAEPSLRLEPLDTPRLPYPDEVRRFMAETKEAILTVGAGIPELQGMADELAKQLAAKGIRATVINESQVGAYPADADAVDPDANGFRTWHQGGDRISPNVAVDKPLILLTPAGGSRLLGELVGQGMLTEQPQGRPGQSVVQPSVQVVKRAFHPDRDTLCVVANDAPGMRKALDALLAGVPAPAPAAAAAAFGAKQSVVSDAATPLARAPGTQGNNEFIEAIQFDPAGNLYVTTGGHGDNLYSFDPAGQLRFSRYLPETHPTGLVVGPDRLLVATALGGRLYQLGLDGKPLSQMRLNQDPGRSKGERTYMPEYATPRYLPREKLLLFGDRAVTLDGKVLGRWQGKLYENKEASDRPLHRGLHSLALSPDGTRVAQIETEMYLTKAGYGQKVSLVEVFDSYLVVRDLTGKILHEYPESLENGSVSGVVSWDAGAPGPGVRVGGENGEQLQFDDRLQLVSRTPLVSSVSPAGAFARFGSQGRLERDGQAVCFFDGRNRAVCRTEPFEIMPTISVLSPDGKTLVFLDERGTLTVIETASGTTRARVTVPELGRTLVFTPDSSRFYLGGLRGTLICYDLQGTVLWQAALAPHNKTLGTSPPLYDPAFPDVSGTIWEEHRDEPGDLDALVRFDGNRILNGTCEAQDGWQGEQVAYADAGRGGGRCLRVGAAPVSQEIKGYIGNHYTWLLEFQYRRAPGSRASELVAGLRMESADSARVARTLVPTDDWQFARVVIKSGKNPQSLLAGFSAEGGEVLVDDVTLRRIRFPSVNHLLHEPVYDVEPVINTNPLFARKYDPLGNLKEEIPNRLIIPALRSGAAMLVEAGFLQNGRLNDTAPDWYVMPNEHEVRLSIGFKEPRWVSMVGLYFNAYDEANVTPNFDVHVTDLDTKTEYQFAAVRGNRKLFYLAKGRPCRAALITITLPNVLWKQYTLTEIEAYGPLSGKEQGGFGDAAGQNTYMGTFARVDKRPKPLDAGPLAVTPVGGGPKWAFPEAQILAADAEIYSSRALGFSDRRATADLGTILSSGRAGGMGFAPRVTLYNGVLLKLGLDGKLYCVDPYSSKELWATPLGQRLSSAPVVIGDDIFVADDRTTDGKGGGLCVLDIASGAIMRELPLSGAARGSLASDGTNLFMITEDGFLQCLPASAAKPAWAVPVAKFSESTPAVDGGVVYLADAAGTAKAVDARTGSVIWSKDLGQECIGCPVVLENRIVVGCRDGQLAVLDRRSGEVLWQKQFADRFCSDPLVLQVRSGEPNSAGEEVVLHCDNGIAKLTRLEDGQSRDLITNDKGEPWGPGSLLAPISYYDGRLFFVPRSVDHANLIYTDTYRVGDGGVFFQVAPPPPPPPAKP